MITKAITRCLKAAQEKGWSRTYWAFDVHGTVLKPTYEPGVVASEFYPYAKEVLQTLSKREEVVLILYTCSYPEEIIEYLKYFEDHNIRFAHINENPEVVTGAYGHYDRKFYFNVLFEDKAGFDPLTDWKLVQELLQTLNFT